MPLVESSYFPNRCEPEHDSTHSSGDTNRRRTLLWMRGMAGTVPDESFPENKLSPRLTLIRRRRLIIHKYSSAHRRGNVP